MLSNIIKVCFGRYMVFKLLLYLMLFMMYFYICFLFCAIIWHSICIYYNSTIINLNNKVMKIKLIGIFDSADIDNVVKVDRVPNNATRLLNVLDNCRIYTNHSFIFFKGHGEKFSVYKTEYSYKLEVKIKSLI